MLKPGDPAPPFRLASTSGQEASLEDLRGRKAVLYFYPRDETPGCTQEACEFRDRIGLLERAGVVVLGVSKDSLESHQQFRARHGLPFHLLSDPDNTVAKAYGAYGERDMYGTKVLGTIRSTFLLDEYGRIERVWSPVRVAGHADEVLRALGLARPEAAAMEAGAAEAGPSPSAIPSSGPAAGPGGGAAPRAPVRAPGPGLAVPAAAPSPKPRPARGGTGPAPGSSPQPTPARGAAGSRKESGKVTRPKAASRTSAPKGKAAGKAAGPCGGSRGKVRRKAASAARRKAGRKTGARRPARAKARKARLRR